MPDRGRRALLLAISVGVVSSAVVGLLLVPVPRPFAFRGTLVTGFAGSCPGLETADGASVAYSWVAPVSVQFSVVSCATNALVSLSVGVHGSGSFVSTGGVYRFGTDCPSGPCVAANVSGTISEPIL